MKHLIYGRRVLQPLFEKALTVAMGGMNLGNVDLRRNGEAWLLKQLPRGSRPAVIFDVGANSGEYAVAALDAAGPCVAVHCFEPSPAAFQELSRILGRNQAVVLNKVGLSSQDGARAILHCNTHGGTGSSLIAKNLPDGEFEYRLTEEVALRTLDSYATQHQVDRIDLLKIDVEGLELEVLRGAEHLLSTGRIDRIQFEFGEGSVTAGTHFRDFYALLSPQYNLARLVKDGLRPISRYSIVLEQYVTANYVATRKGLQH